MTVPDPPTRADTVRLTHIGAATCLIEVGGIRLLTDPALEPAGRTHVLPTRMLTISAVRTNAPRYNPDQLRDLDAVLLSHDEHFDNLDRAGRRVLPGAGTVLTTRSGARRLGGNAVGLVPWQEIWLRSRHEHFEMRVIAAPARHGPPAMWRLAGRVIGFVLIWEGQRRGAVYLSGDTRLFAGVREVGRRFRVGTALLNIGAGRFRATGPVRYSMTAREAARAAAALNAHTIVPIHYEGWSHLREGRPAAERVLASRLGARRVCWLPIGVPHEVEV